MALEDVFASVTKWTEAANALGALGAELAAIHGNADVPPEVRAALHEVTTAAGLGDLTELPSPQAQSVMAIIRTFLHQAADIADNPGRAGGWTFTDTAILDGFGRASMMMPVLIAGARPDWEVRSFLDVGTGVGLLAVSATNVWPDCEVVGIDTWEASLERARKNVADAGVADRITLRNQDFADLDDRDAFDLVWVPSFFMSEVALAAGLANVAQALRPGGHVVVATNKQPTGPLEAAIANLESVRSGGSAIPADTAVALLTRAGLAGVEITGAGPAPVDFVIGTRMA